MIVDHARWDSNRHGVTPDDESAAPSRLVERAKRILVSVDASGLSAAYELGAQGTQLCHA
jgi:hypothetical protein